MNALVLLIRDTLKPLCSRLALYLGASLVLQALYWYYGSPGPQLLPGYERTIVNALVNIAWALGLLFLAPLLLMSLAGESPVRAGLRLGDVRFGLTATLPVALVAVVLLYFGTADASLQATYPWAGAFPGRSILHLLLWIPLYGLYYLAFEFFYRGVIIKVLEPHWGLDAAIWVQAVMSVLIHLGKPLTETLAAIPAAFLFAALALRSRSLLYPVLLHLIIGLATDIFSLQRQGLLFP